MSFPKRMLLAVLILLLDFAMVFIPLAAVFLAYVIVFNPPWFREFLNSLPKEADHG